MIETRERAWDDMTVSRKSFFKKICNRAGHVHQSCHTGRVLVRLFAQGFDKQGFQPNRCQSVAWGKPDHKCDSRLTGMTFFNEIKIPEENRKAVYDGISKEFGSSG